VRSARRCPVRSAALASPFENSQPRAALNLRAKRAVHRLQMKRVRGVIPSGGSIGFPPEIEQNNICGAAWKQAAIAAKFSLRVTQRYEVSSSRPVRYRGMSRNGWFDLFPASIK
jgi:hypothetical protein